MSLRYWSKCLSRLGRTCAQLRLRHPSPLFSRISFCLGQDRKNNSWETLFKIGQHLQTLGKTLGQTLGIQTKLQLQQCGDFLAGSLFSSSEAWSNWSGSTRQGLERPLLGTGRFWAKSGHAWLRGGRDHFFRDPAKWRRFLCGFPEKDPSSQNKKDMAGSKFPKVGRNSIFRSSHILRGRAVCSQRKDIALSN